MGDPNGCIKVNPCKCLMKDGSGVVNLAALGNMAGFLTQNMKVRREVQGKSVEQSITFSPCHPFSEPMALVNCSHVAVCVVSRDPEAKENVPQYTGFGTHDGNEFVYSNESKILSVTYRASQESPLRTVVHYNCSSVSMVTFPPVEDMTEVLEILVQSPCACPSSCQAEDVGPGNIILIMFVVSLTAYFLFGVSTLRSMQTLEGSHVTPEPHIWCGICSLFWRNQKPILTDESCHEEDSLEYFNV
ncbi:uncharacterized protein LOC130290830 [Hyla sarda]|uniref:uncharacterized protein LOC130290830 n=1 Tax=Hyla sarda TaxID=327740 RepID=UPI0024C3BF2B|nr:uncharacterized protein LOC130290830 [Hyla sarda]XP_056394924.1 uncharacterized protein LOC130290830 [Hyla sarda]XP_056394925.1 uncharacterized protein LOC130290830 [Hyla sarda]